RVLAPLGPLDRIRAKMQHRCFALSARARATRIVPGAHRTRLALLVRVHHSRPGHSRRGAEALGRLQLHQSESEAERFRPEGSRSAGVLWLQSGTGERAMT